MGHSHIDRCPAAAIYQKAMGLAALIIGLLVVVAWILAQVL